MKSSHLINGILLVGMTAMAGTASAALTGSQTAVVDFETATSGAYYGKSNTSDPNQSACSADIECYIQNGFVVGTVYDPKPKGAFAHLHLGNDNAADQDIYTHADAAGFYVRAEDNSAFSLTSLDLSVPVNPANPNATGKWELLGFSEAYNPGGPGPYANQVGNTVFINNGTTDTTSLANNADFSNIKAFWLHYQGVTAVPPATPPFHGSLDNIKLAAPAIVPVPAAVWLFGTGLMGFLAMGKKRRFI